MNRRTYLAGATGAVAFLGGCIGAPAAEPGGDPTNSPPDGEPTPHDTTTDSIRSPSETATTHSPTEGEPIGSVTMTEDGPGTTTALPQECRNVARLPELSPASREEFRLALNGEGLTRTESDDFRIAEELSNVDDEIGFETCVLFNGKHYYPVFGPIDGSSDQKWKLTYMPAESESATGDEAGLTDGGPTTGIDTPEGDTERTAKTKTETVGACDGVRYISFYGLESDEADELWGPSTVRAAFALGAGANVRLVVLEDDTVLGTTLIPPPDGAVAVDGQPIPLDTDLSGDHTIRVVVYPHSGESNGFDIERTTPCRHEGDVVQTEPTTIDFDRFSPNTSSA